MSDVRCRTAGPRTQTSFNCDCGVRLSLDDTYGTECVVVCTSCGTRYHHMPQPPRPARLRPIRQGDPEPKL